jgi:class 3 adenylate cyclase
MAQQTFLFADAPDGTPTPGEIAARFTDALTTYDGECLATIGATVMVRLARATDAVTLALHLTDHTDDRLRIGMNTGTALRADGLWAGPVVELAARVANHATPGDVLVTAATRQATDRGTVDFTDAGTPALHDDGRHVALYRPRHVVGP